MGYCWILLCQDKNYSYKKDKWLDICKRTQEIRNKLAENGIEPEEMMEMMTRCRNFMNKDFQDMDLDQKVAFTQIAFI